VEDRPLAHQAKDEDLHAPLAGEMSGHMFFGGDWYGFDDALFAAARLLAYVAREGGPLSRRLADLRARRDPELRVDCPDERKFAIVEQAARHFAARYPSPRSTACASRPRRVGSAARVEHGPRAVMRFEATRADALAAYRRESRAGSPPPGGRVKPRRSWLLVVGVALVAVLVGGRWLALETAERAWPTRSAAAISTSRPATCRS